MKQINLFILLIATCILSGSDCNPDEGPFIPDLSQNWYKVGEPTNLFFFINIATPNSNSSNFTGNNDFNGTFRTFSGKFTNKAIEFTIDNTTESYKGTISADSKEMSLNNNSVILRKQ